jgi:activator of HSP90 ATPase
MRESLKMSVDLEAAPEVVYRAWIDPVEHGRFIDAEAEIEPKVGGAFRLWDGYITGTTVALEPPRRIVQRWRTTEFPEGSPDSNLEVRFDPAGSGTRLTLSQTDLPVGQGATYEAGWKENYFDRMQAHFASKP